MLFLVPIYTIAIFVELLLFKLKIINYDNPVNVSKRGQIVFYSILVLLILFCILLLFLNEPVTEEQLRFD